MEIKSGCLYVVGTPIGNLSDISERAIYTLKNVDFIAAEDTRVTGLLLFKMGIKKSLVSCREHNIVTKSIEIIERLEKGESCAVVTDAGMPCISDPGEGLVRFCHEHGISVYVVPGPCALTSALAISGFPSKRFSFEGFLSTNRKQRTLHLDSLKNSPYTLIFYEAPHKLKYTLADLLEFLGDRKIAICRELTKIYEEVLCGTISEMLSLYEEKSPKGEYVLIVESSGESSVVQTGIQEAAVKALDLHESGLSLSKAAKIVSEQTGLKKSDIYKEVTISKEEKEFKNG